MLTALYFVITAVFVLFTWKAAQIYRQGRSSYALLLTIVLAAQPTGLARLPGGLLEMADLRIDLAAWEPADTARFIETSLAKAGRSAPAFGESAIARLHELSGGIPRRVSQLAELALVAGAGRRLASIDAETVESACLELGAVEVPARASASHLR